MSVWDALRARKRALDAEARALSTEIRKNKRAARDRAVAQARAWVLDEGVRRRALLIYVAADCCTDPAVVYLTSIGRERHWFDLADKSEDDLARLVDELFFSHISEVLELCDPEAPRDPDAMRDALEYVVQWYTLQWNHSQNRCGFFPVTQQVAEQFELLGAQWPDALRPRRWVGTPGARKKATRWRRRFKVRFGAARAREVLPVEEMQAKALRAGVGICVVCICVCVCWRLWVVCVCVCVFVCLSTPVCAHVRL